MNHDSLIKATNRVAILATGALIYWVFIFLTITIFDLQIFRVRMTDLFYLSLMGIFAILGAAIILNVMSNLSKISGALSSSGSPDNVGKSTEKWPLYLALASFPLIGACLFAGHELSSQNTKAQLTKSAENLITENQKALAFLAEYKFTPEFVKSAERALGIVEKIDRNFSDIMVLFPDTIDGKEVFLVFGGGRHLHEDRKIEKSDFIYTTSLNEREYLTSVFKGTETNHKFRVENRDYQLYFPTTMGGKRIVFFFSQFQRYGRFGS